MSIEDIIIGIVKDCRASKALDEYWPELIAEEVCTMKDFSDLDAINDSLFSIMSPLVDEESICAIASAIHGRMGAPSQGNLMNRLNRVYAKEIRKRPYHAGDISVSTDMLACSHTWHHTSIAQNCMVCDHTCKELWQCLDGCGVELCGSCCFKWKTKLAAA